MAPKQASNPFLTKLLKMSGEFNEAKVIKDPYGELTAPEGLYIGRVADATYQVTKGSQDPMVLISTPFIGDTNGDAKYAGTPGKLMHIIKASEKQTVVQVMARLCQDIERLGYDPAEFSGPQDMVAALEAIKNDAAFVLLEVYTYSGSQRLRLKGRIAPEEVAALFGEGVLGDMPTPATPQEESTEAAELDTSTWEWQEEHNLWYDTATELWYNQDGSPYDPNATAEGYEEVAQEPEPAPPPAPAPKPTPAAKPAAKPSPAKPAPAAAKPAAPTKPAPSKPAGPKAPPKPR